MTLHFRLSRQADRDALDERTGRAWRPESPDTYWGKVMLEAKSKNLIVIPDVDCCTAWCLVKAGQVAKSMQAAGRTSFSPASATWALLLTRAWAMKYAVPYFEMNLNAELSDLSLLEWAVSMGGVAAEIAEAATKRFALPRKNDAITLDGTDVMRLEAAAAGRRAALADEAATTAKQKQL